MARWAVSRQSAVSHTSVVSAPSELCEGLGWEGQDDAHAERGDRHRLLEEDREIGSRRLGLGYGVGDGAEADAVAGFEEDGVGGLEGVAEVGFEGFAGGVERVGVIEGG